VAFALLLSAGCTPSEDEPPDEPLTPQDLMAEVDAARYEEILTYTAVERVPGDEGWQMVQDFLYDELEALGFAVELHSYGTGHNIIAVLEGGERADEWVVVSAHYDHIAGCPGADDNASGLAAILENARVLSQASFERTLVVASWDEEELGLIGAEAWVEEAAERGEAIVSSIVYDTFAYTCDEPECQQLPFGFELLIPDQAEQLADNEYRGDFVALFGNEASAGTMETLTAHSDDIALNQLSVALSDELIANPAMSDLQRSDHAPFWDAGYPAIFITDTANFRNPNYHCLGGQDTPDTLDLPFAVDVVRAVTGALAEDLMIQP